MIASILASGVVPQETRTVLLRSLPALFIGSDTSAIWVRDSTNPDLSFFVAKSPDDALQWIRQSCKPEVLPQLEPVNAANANRDSRPPPQDPTEDDSDYGSPVQFQSTATAAAAAVVVVDDDEDGPNRTPNTGNNSEQGKRKRPASDAPPPSAEPPAKRPRNHATTPDPEYIITVSNANRSKERKRRKRLEAKLSEVFVTEEEDNIQDTYIQENGRTLAWLAKQPACVGMGRREASALIYRASAIGSWEAIENVRAVLAHWRKNGAVNLNRQTPPPQSTSQSLVTFTCSSQSINAALLGFRKAFFDVASIEATGILQDILYRHHLAHLYTCYRSAEALLDCSQLNGRGRGVGNASLVKHRLFKALYPSADAPSSSSLANSSVPSGTQWRYFTKCLTKGHRWHRMREALGSGIFALIPTSKIPHSFLERLPSGVFRVFLELIQRFYPDAVKFGQLIEDFIQNALAGQQPPHAYLPIEGIGEDQLQEMDLSDVLQLFKQQHHPPILAIEDISSSPASQVTGTNLSSSIPQGE